MSTYINKYGEIEVRSPANEVWQWFKRDNQAMFGLLLLSLILTFILLSPFLAPYSPLKQFPEQVLLPPAWEPHGELRHLLGTDELGRDQFSRILLGGRVTLGLAATAIVGAFLLGSIATFLVIRLGRVATAITDFIINSLLSIPPLVLALISMMLTGFGLRSALVALLVAYTPIFFRVFHQEIRKQMKAPYAIAAKMDGTPTMRLIFSQVLPTALPAVVSESTRMTTLSIIDVATLGFFGFLSQSDFPEWGSMLGTGQNFAYQAPWLVWLPGIVLAIALLAIHLVGSGVRRAIERQRG